MPRPEESLYSIGAVARMTAISEATLRVWERRYHFPRTTRTTGGHRLYSQQEVLDLQWVKIRIDEGMQAGRAIHALHHIEKGKAVASALYQPLQMPVRGEDPNLAKIQRRLVQALLAYDTEGANQILDEAVTFFPLEQVALEIIRPTLVVIGEAWSSGQLEVATEHYATNYLRHHLLMWMQIGPPCYQVDSVVLACAPGELHEGSLLILGALLRELRWPVLYLGQSLPLANLASFTNIVRLSIIVFVAMSEATALAMAEWPHWLPQIAGIELPIIGYGGRAFIENPELAAHVPGVLLGSTLHEGIARLHRLLLDLNSLTT